MIYSSGYSYPVPIAWTDFADEVALCSDAITKLGAFGQWPAPRKSERLGPDDFVFQSRQRKPVEQRSRAILSSPAFRSARAL